MIKNMPLLVLMGSLLDAFVKLTLIMILIGCKKIYSNKKFWISTFILGLYVFKINYTLSVNNSMFNIHNSWAKN